MMTCMNVQIDLQLFNSKFALNTNKRYYKVLISLAQSLEHDMENIPFNENDAEYQPYFVYL